MQLSCLVVAITLVGCDTVFQVDRVELPSGDARVAGACPATFGTSRYLYVDMPLYWVPAEAHCRRLDDDLDDGLFTHLVVATSHAEILELPLPAGAIAWTGLNDLDRSEPGAEPPLEYTWITDEQPADIPWGIAQPDSGATYRVGEVRWQEGAIFDTHFAQELPFVCECDQWPVVPEKFM